MSRIAESSRYVCFPLRVLVAVISGLGHNRERNSVYHLYGFALSFSNRGSCPESFVLRIRDAYGSDLYEGEILGNRHPVPISGRSVPDKR